MIDSKTAISDLRDFLTDDVAADAPNAAELHQAQSELSDILEKASVIQDRADDIAERWLKLNNIRYDRIEGIKLHSADRIEIHYRQDTWWDHETLPLRFLWDPKALELLEQAERAIAEERAQAVVEKLRAQEREKREQERATFERLKKKFG